MTMGRVYGEVSRSLTNQPPQDEKIVLIMEALRVPFKAAAAHVLDLVPVGREQSLALTKIEEALMWGIKGIALHQEEILSQQEATNGSENER